jgi:CRISPR-associated exonuclease Cas4
VTTFSDLARAAYCPRQLYYTRREGDRQLPPRVRDRIDLAFRYPELRRAGDETLIELPIRREPAAYRDALETVRTRDDWSDLVAPAERRVLLDGKDARGIAHKVLDIEDDPIPSLVSPGAPPEQGVWEPQRVRAVAAAKALAWERDTSVERALVEYPASGVVRTVRLTTRNCAAYRRTLRTVRDLDGPPARIEDSAKCEPCEYRERCGVRTRSLRSMLGL